VHFTGDGFVKSNVIIRLLQQDVEHAAKDEAARSAITAANYKFSYKGSAVIDGREAHIFQVKPRAKAPGLFQGKIYIDASRGSLRPPGICRTVKLQRASAAQTHRSSAVSASAGALDHAPDLARPAVCPLAARDKRASTAGTAAAGT